MDNGIELPTRRLVPSPTRLLWALLCVSACALVSAQQADYEAQRVLEQAVTQAKSGAPSQALALLGQVTASQCCARLKGMAYAWQGRVLIEGGETRKGLEAYALAMGQFAGAYDDAVAAKDDDKTSQVLFWRVRVVLRTFETGAIADQDARHHYAVAAKCLEQSRTVVMPVANKLDLEQDMRELEKLWAGMASHYGDVIAVARAAYDAGRYAECRDHLVEWESPPEFPKDATPLDVAMGAQLRAMALCRLSMQEDDEGEAEELFRAGRALLAHSELCTDESKAEAQQVLSAAAARLGTKQYAMALTDAWKLYEAGEYASCLDMLRPWERPGQAPPDALADQAAEGFNLRACCFFRLAMAETDQSSFEATMARADELFRHGTGCSEAGRLEGETARNDVYANRYGGLLRRGTAQYSSGQYEEALSTLEPWTHLSPPPVGATDSQNIQGFRLRALTLCRLAMLTADDARSEGLIGEAQGLLRHEEEPPVKDRGDVAKVLREALITLGKRRFAAGSYDSAYRSLVEANGLLESTELRFLLAECHQLTPASGEPYTGPAFLRDSIFIYRHVIDNAPDGPEKTQSTARLPEVVARCNQTALMQLAAEQWGDNAIAVQTLLRRCLTDHYGTWWRPEPEAVATDGPGFLFDCVIDATSVEAALDAARQRGDMWLLKVEAPACVTDSTGVIAGLTFVVGVYASSDGQLAASVPVEYAAQRVSKRDQSGQLADQLLRDIRDSFASDVVRKAPLLMGDLAPAID